MTEAEENLFLLVAQFSYRDRCPRYIVKAVKTVLEEQERNKLKVRAERFSKHRECIDRKLYNRMFNAQLPIEPMWWEQE